MCAAHTHILSTSNLVQKNILGFDRTRWKKYVGECVCVHSLTAMSPAFTLVVDVLAAVVPVDVLWDTRFWVVLGLTVTPPSVGATDVAIAIFVTRLPTHPFTLF